MTSEGVGLRVAIDTAGDATLVVPVGLLTLAGAPMLRAALLRCLADQPAAVIVDLGVMHADAPDLLSVFRSAARASARWSGVPLLLVSDLATERRLWLTRTALSRLVRVFPTHALALASIDRPVPRRLFERVLASRTANAQVARESAGRMSVAWGCVPILDAVVLVADELVTNAIRHGHGPVVFRMELRHRQLTVSVADESPDLPVLRLAADQGTRKDANLGGDSRGNGRGAGGDGGAVAVDRPIGGYGLHLVEALTQRWGTTPTTTGGKVIWAVFDATRTRPAVGSR